MNIQSPKTGPPDYFQKSPRGKRKGKGKKASRKEEGDESDQEDEDVPNFPKALYEHVAKKKNATKNSQRKGSRHHNPFHGMHPKNVAKVKYTNDLWRDVP